MPKPKVRVACYARYSTSMQREESIVAQKRAMRKFCTDNGWKIVKIYVDEAYSATSDRRPQFQQMIEDSGQHLFDIVLVHKLDRFARNRYDSSIYKQKLMKNGVRLCSVLERLDDSPESILLEGLLESISEFYSANLARETMKGLKENAIKCLHNGGRPGLGYQVDKSKHIIINEQEAEAVRIIYRMYLNGYSYQEIADTLNARGYRTQTGNPFAKTSFQEILRNEKYTGVYIYNRAEAKDFEHKRNNRRRKPPEEIIRIEGGIPAIIDRETWETVQKMLTERKKSARRRNGILYLLSGSVKCGVCGARMLGTIRLRRNLPDYRTYSCRTKKAACTNSKEIEKESLERHVVQLVKENCLRYMDTETAERFCRSDLSDRECRSILQKYLYEVQVYPDTVAVKLLVGDTVRAFYSDREQFRTPTRERRRR